MLRTRIITAVVLLAIVAGSLYVSNSVFEYVMAVAFAFTFGEWLRLQKLPLPACGVLGAAMGAVMASMAWQGWDPAAQWFSGIVELVSICWLAIVVAVELKRKTGLKVPRMLGIVLGFVFVPVAYLSLVWFVEKGGWPLMLSVFVLIWLTDIGAYFTGRACGKTKMAPAISPGKTWAGAVGAVVWVLVAATAAWFALPHEQVFTSLLIEKAGWSSAFFIMVLLVAISIAGDLFESALKRQAGVKDSGWALPGHGGFYDRLDSSTAVFPCAAVWLLIL